MDKPSLPKGTRDFGPAQMSRRLYLLDTIRSVFQRYGFQPLETPAMENLSTLTGKYGEEGDQLLFRILNSGDFLKSADPQLLAAGQSRTVAPQISEKGLRYDLTVPFARFVVMNQHEIAFPFRRYQIQPVWRADRPQKGRYREFYQCDADVVGTDSLLCEAEIVLMIREVFGKLGIRDYSIKLNHRDVLAGLAAIAGAEGKETAFCVALDKLDKTGTESVKADLQSLGLPVAELNRVFGLLEHAGDPKEKLSMLEKSFTSNGKRGLEDLRELLQLLEGTPEGLAHVDFDLTLARGLSYYTGCIFEVKVKGASVGSVSGGGRYDNLTQSFGAREKLSGVGISFGIDRLYDVLEEFSLFPAGTGASATVLLCHFDAETRAYAFRTAGILRNAGIAAEVYPDLAKIKKQFEFANRKGIGHVVVVGEQEMKTGELTLKNLATGMQETLAADAIIQRLHGK